MRKGPRGWLMLIRCRRCRRRSEGGSRHHFPAGFRSECSSRLDSSYAISQRSFSRELNRTTRIVITVITTSIGISLFSDWKHRSRTVLLRELRPLSSPDFLPVVFSSSYPPIASKHPPAYGSAISFVESMPYRTSTYNMRVSQAYVSFAHDMRSAP
jgi:hypothetical protein